MARYTFINTDTKAKVPYTLGNCSEGDIVSIPNEGIDIGIITDDNVGYGYIAVADFEGGTVCEISESTPCRRYTGTLEIDNKLFEDFI